MDGRKALVLALGMLGLGLAVIGAGLVMSERGASMAFAAPPAPGVAAALTISTATLSEDQALICLVDAAHQRLAVYLADGKRSRLKLLAVRDLSADWALTDYNNDPPLPKDIRTRIEKGTESPPPAAEDKPKPSEGGSY